jgi:hypothetical protein
VRAIRRLCVRGKTLGEIADHFGVSKTTISVVKNRKTWKHA